MKRRIAIVPTTLDQKLFGESIGIVDNYISVNAETDIAEFFGPKASRYSYVPELRSRITDLVQARRRSTNAYFVLNGPVCIAAQSTLNGAMHYMTPETVLVLVA